MGWGGGSNICADLIKSFYHLIPENVLRVKVYKAIIEALENEDWDNVYECCGQDEAFDIAVKELHPEWEINDE